MYLANFTKKLETPMIKPNPNRLKLKGVLNRIFWVLSETKFTCVFLSLPRKVLEAPIHFTEVYRRTLRSLLLELRKVVREGSGCLLQGLAEGSSPVGKNILLQHS